MLGKRLKELRLSRELSLRALATATGLSATLLSQIEREVTEPSLTTLRRLSNVFGESMSALFADPSAPSVWISRPGERTTLMVPKGGVSYERLTRGNGQMEVLRAVFQPGQFSSETPLKHPALESVYVLRGTLSVVIGDVHYVVNAGENIAFDANAAHRYINEGQEAVEILMSITPPVP